MPSSADVIWAVVPVKDFRAAKSRLKNVLSATDRTRLARAMAADVIAALKQSGTTEHLCILSDSADTRGFAAALGSTWFEEKSVATLPGLNAGIAGMARLAASDGATALLVIHADMPLLTAADIRHVVSAWQSLEGDQRVVMVRSRDGGTNILLAERPHAFAYRYGPDSHGRHVQECARRHCTAATVELSASAFDIDTPDDLYSLARAVRHDGRCGAHTAALLDELMPAERFADVSTCQEIAP
ncbi:2-phospho-L-lactate guanylyltransferase [Pseudomonas sp. NFACC07-1]|uniref:2-phospho-L-lactate guanylyltransferase n=1 Tax=Pseudomonas sp. NFACC07-1 TaxID=1566239 RepID=UPI0008D70E14|nr:2-phospho-L-lactate guanylyltransferase [Pseudomonas sp. NFACC07-1]SEI53880.1 2-phospho-L-lactate guanylyltransferase [Pseudomonas sp. NFACC07-1]